MSTRITGFLGRLIAFGLLARPAIQAARSHAQYHTCTRATMREYMDSRYNTREHTRSHPPQPESHSMRYLLLALVIWRDGILGVYPTHYPPLVRDIESTCTSCHQAHISPPHAKERSEKVAQGELDMLKLPRSRYSKVNHQEISGIPEARGRASFPSRAFLRFSS